MIKLQDIQYWGAEEGGYWPIATLDNFSTNNDLLRNNDISFFDD